MTRSSRSRSSDRFQKSSSLTKKNDAKKTTAAVESNRRSSSRSNKFNASFKEPEIDSMKDWMMYETRSESQPISKAAISKRRSVIVHGTGRLSPSPSKTKAVRHSSTRKHIHKVDSLSEDEDLDEEEEEQEEEEEDEEKQSQELSGQDSTTEEEPPKIQRILAVRMETLRHWHTIGQKINTSEIDNGSRWYQEAITNEQDWDKYEERFLIKWADLSFLHCSWEKETDLMDQVDNAKAYLTAFFKKSTAGYFYDTDERLDGEYFDPGFCQIERILEVNTEGCKKPMNANIRDSAIGNRRSRANSTTNSNPEIHNDHDNPWGIILDKEHPNYDDATGRQLLIKWGNTPYSDASYEYERDLILMDVEYESHLQDFEKRTQKPTESQIKKHLSEREDGHRRMYKIFGDNMHNDASKQKLIEEYKKDLEMKVFPNGGTLRDYQAEGVSWLMANHINGRSSILADEMGLGKTIQTAAYVNLLHSDLHLRGPFLIVAPLSTIPHWQREFAGWTDLNTIVYHGSYEDRDVIRQYEFAYERDRPMGGVGFNQRYLKKCHSSCKSDRDKLWMVDVVITTPEMLITEDFVEFTTVHWDLLVVDEAHRLKSHSSRLSSNLRHDNFKFKHKLLLTGTPIQNNMSELWALMNVVDPKRFNDCDKFMTKFDKMQSKDLVDELHVMIRPYILRRLKEDVEKSVPPKEETLVEVEMTVLQKQYYRALYEKNVGFLHQGNKKAIDGPSLNNLSMQLRKCCNHPFLLEGVEEKAKKGLSFSTSDDEADFLAHSSGKLVLLDKLLPKLKAGGHRVLLFSQFKIMLDIIEDYLSLRKFKFERIDGSITGKKRQMAIDRFQSGESLDASFIMLLSTRAGGVGINLTAADTCIIFDSDWNPQNDLQAQARCHRIGQKKSVKIYRLLTGKSYEMQMFHMSSMKMGLDQAVLQGFEAVSSEEGPNMTKEEIERLLRHGAYDMFREEQEGASEKESNEFMNQDIDTILERRATTVTHENTGSGSTAAGGKFSKASFSTSISNSMKNGIETKNVDIDDPDFWRKMVGEGEVEVDANLLASGQKRSRKQAIYSEKVFDEGFNSLIMFDGDDSSSSADSANDDESSYDTDDEDLIAWDDFDLEEDEDLQNPFLNDLKSRCIEKAKWNERRRWGGKKLLNWNRADADHVVKLLHRFGYQNIKWSDFYTHFRAVSKKDYSDDEIKRMCWSICLVGLYEAVKENVQDTARRIDRKGKKELDDSGDVERIDDCDKVTADTSGDITNDDSIIDTSSDLWKRQQLEASFRKIIHSQNWVDSVLIDVREFSKCGTCRDISCISPKSIVVSSPRSGMSLTRFFEESILPALKTRGWTVRSAEGTRKKNSIVSPKGIEYRTVAKLLDGLPFFYPELQGTIHSILETVQNSLSKSTAELQKPDEIDLQIDTLNFGALEETILKFAPMQLVIDRIEFKKLALTPNRMLNTLTNLRLSHQLLKSALDHSMQLNFYESCRLISLKLNVNPKAALPHPLWTSMHDAILLSAITRHGWLDRDSHCKAILADKEIRWGYPFDNAYRDELHEDCANGGSKIAGREMLQTVASRAVSFLNSVGSDDMKDSKGFNVSLVLETYRIRRSDDDEQSCWIISNDEIQSVSHSNEVKNFHLEEMADLPSRKDLLRRARILLNGNSSAPGEATPSSTKGHDYALLDQSDPNNIFLAELLREAIRASQKKQKWVSNVLNTAINEADMRCKETAPNMDASGSLEGSKEHEDMKQILKHIHLVMRHSKPLVRGAKNILRAILGIELHQPNKSGESLFVQERKPVSFVSIPKSDATVSKAIDEPSQVVSSQNANKDSSIPAKKTNKKKKEQFSDCTRGDLAVNKALLRGKQMYPFLAATEPESFLKLTSIETLILSVLCSQGIPICNDNWFLSIDGSFDEDEIHALSWAQIGSVLEAAAEAWYNMAARKVNAMNENDSRLSEAELSARQLVLFDAIQLRSNPSALAKKVIMLLQAVRLNSKILKTFAKEKSKYDSGIGMKCLQWNSAHMNRWAEILSLVNIDGTIIAMTACAARPDLSPASYLDEDGCDKIYSQIAQQSRLRAIFLKTKGRNLSNMILTAMRKCEQKYPVWEDKPSWWGNGECPESDDRDLLSGILQYGYGGFHEILSQNERFSRHMSTESNELPFSRISAQNRIDMMTRQLGIIDDANTSFQLLRDAKGNTNTGSGSRQVGIQSFFAPKKATQSTEVIEIDSDDTSVIEVKSIAESEESLDGKRKMKGVHQTCSPSKKTKS